MHSPIEPAEFLCISEILSEIDMEEVSRLFDHDVVVVPIANAENIRGYAVSRTGIGEIFQSDAKLSFGAVV